MNHICGTCKGEINQRALSILCNGNCALWHHASCVRLIKSDITFYMNEAKKRTGKRWFCNGCGLKDSELNLELVDQAQDDNLVSSKLLEQLLVEHFSQFKMEFKTDMEETMKKWTDTIKLLEVRVNGLEEENKNLRSEILQIKTAKQSQQSNADEVLQEVNDRFSRRCNIIVCGVTDSNDADCDKIVVDGIVEAVLGRPVTRTRKLYRLGKFNDRQQKPRLLKVTLENDEQAQSIIEKARVLKDHQDFSNIFIWQDKTPRQLEEYRNLKTELLYRRNEGKEEGIGIRYIRGVPKIVPLKKQSLN